MREVSITEGLQRELNRELAKGNKSVDDYELTIDDLVADHRPLQDAVYFDKETASLEQWIEHYGDYNVTSTLSRPFRETYDSLVTRGQTHSDFALQQGIPVHDVQGLLHASEEKRLLAASRLRKGWKYVRTHTDVQWFKS